MLETPGFHAEALAEGEVELAQLRSGYGGVVVAGWLLVALCLRSRFLPLPFPSSSSSSSSSRQKRQWQHHVRPTLFLHLRIVDKRRNRRCGRVNGPEREDVEEDAAAVVEEVADGFADEFEVCVGELGDAVDAVYAVDVGEDAGHCEVTARGGGAFFEGEGGVLREEGGEGNGGEGDVPGVEGWGRGVGGEELEIEGCGGVEGDLGFAVVVEVFEEDL